MQSAATRTHAVRFPVRRGFVAALRFRAYRKNEAASGEQQHVYFVPNGHSGKGPTGEQKMKKRSGKDSSIDWHSSSTAKINKKKPIDRDRPPRTCCVSPSEYDFLLFFLPTSCQKSPYEEKKDPGQLGSRRDGRPTFRPQHHSMHEHAVNAHWFCACLAVPIASVVRRPSETGWPFHAPGSLSVSLALLSTSAATSASESERAWSGSMWVMGYLCPFGDEKEEGAVCGHGR